VCPCPYKNGTIKSILFRVKSLMKKETEKFKASTHYNDWLGTTALDNTDIKEIHHKFQDVIGDEHILGIKASIIENRHAESSIEINVTIYTGKIELDKNNKRLDKKFPILKEYKKDMPLEEFVILFKRIELKFSTKGILETGKIKVIKA
jgi:hypothetical protein